MNEQKVTRSLRRRHLTWITREWEKERRRSGAYIRAIREGNRKEQ